MNQTESFLNFFQFHNGVLTLGQILNTHYSAEYRRMISELRQKGHKIIVKLNRKNPSNNTYFLDSAIPKDLCGERDNRDVTVTSPADLQAEPESKDRRPLPISFDKDGQSEMNIIGDIRYD